MTAVTGSRNAFASWYVSRGRIRRRQWWAYLLVFLVLGLVASWLDRTWFPHAVLGVHPDDDARPLLWPWFFPLHGGPATGVIGLALLVPQVSGMVTRLHDRDHSAWWLLWSLLPGIGWVVLVVTICFLGTQPRTNRYGPPPR
jgi:uncharacterized membrane protein YhaH (DUF805 family)